MGKTTRRSHYVWKFYLEPWTNNNYIHCKFKENKKVIYCNIDNVANKRDLYKFTQFNIFERGFLLRAIDKNLPQNIQKTLKDFVNYCYTSSCIKENICLLDKTKKDEINKLNIQKGENFIGNIEKHGREYLLHLRKGNLSFCLQDEEIVNFYVFICMQYLRTKLMYDRFATDCGNNQLLNFANIINLLRYIMSFNIANLLIMDKYNVVLLLNDTLHEFITGDQPIINTFMDYSKQYNNIQNMELYYPISPNKAILITKKEEFVNTYQKQLDINEVDFYNTLIINASQSQIYFKDENILDKYKNI